MAGWWSLFATTFAVVLVAELGDKTQLAAFGLASAGKHPWAVFLGSSAALVVASALAVGAARLLSKAVDPRWLHYGGAALFVLVGVVMLARGPEVEAGASGPPAADASAEPGVAAPGEAR